MTRLALVALYIVIAVWAAIDQKPARLVADGTAYHAMATQYSAGARVVTAEAPFVMRIATPWLASQLDPVVRRILPDGLELSIEEANGLKGFPGFYAVNLAASLLATLLLYWYLTLLVEDVRVRCLLMALWIMQWHGPVRFTFFYPAYIDPLFLALLFAGLAVSELGARGRFGAAAMCASALAFAATFSRETAVLIPLLFAARHWKRLLHPERALDRLLVILPFVVVVPAFAIVRELTVPLRPFDPFGGPLQMLREKPVFTWFLAWFFSFGPATLGVILSSWEQVVRVVKARPELATYLLSCGVLGYVGGTDTERILTWAWPAVLVLLATAIGHHARVWARAPWLALALVGLAMISARIFWSIPAGIDDETPMRELGLNWSSVVVILDKTLVMNNYYANLWSFFGSRALHAAQLVYDLLLTGAIAYAIRRQHQRT